MGGPSRVQAAPVLYVRVRPGDGQHTGGHHEQKSKNHSKHIIIDWRVKHAIWYIFSWRTIHSGCLMFGIDHEYLRKFYTLIALAGAVTAVGIRIAVYEERLSDLKSDVSTLEDKVSFLESISLSRETQDTYHTGEIKQLREDIKELYRKL